jgi:hypothetical protein
VERDHSPFGRSPTGGEDAREASLSTEAKGELTPPPRKPPTAVSAAASDPEPRPPRPLGRWTAPPRRTDLPPAIARAVDAALDTLDSIGDAIRSAARGLAR